jgi:hypothetical protein
MNRAGRDSFVPRRVSDLASRQDGLITTEQLRSLGVDGDQILRWHRTGWLHVRHLNVFSVGHRAWTPRGGRLAAVLAAGDGAALSHVSSAVHRGLLDWTLHSIDVMVPRSGERDRRGIRFHRPRVFGPEDVEEWDGIPCTTVARTLVDLAAAVTPRQLERAVQRAEYLGLLDVKEITDVLRRIKRPRGVRHLRQILGRPRLEGSAAESGLECEYLRLILNAGIEPPVLQVRFSIGAERWARVDFHWPRHRLVVEVDGPHHALPLFAAADLRRDAHLAELGLHVERFTDLDVETAPARVVARTHALTSSRDE